MVNEDDDYKVKELAMGGRFIKHFEDTMQNLAEGLHKDGLG